MQHSSAARSTTITTTAAIQDAFLCFVAMAITFAKLDGGSDTGGGEPSAADGASSAGCASGACVVPLRRSHECPLTRANTTNQRMLLMSP